MAGEEWIAIAADESALLDAVRTRFIEGPFREASDGEAPSRTVEIRRAGSGAYVVHHAGVAVRGYDFLRRWLTTKLATTTRQQVRFGGVDPEEASLLAADGARSRVAPFDVLATTAPLLRRDFVLDPARQRSAYSAFTARIEPQIASLFPIQTRSRLAHLALKSHHEYGPNATYSEGIFRYEMAVWLELKLTLFARPRNDDERRGPVTAVRKEKVCFSRYNVLTPAGAFVERGNEIAIPADEYGADWLDGMTRFATTIRNRMDERSEWDRVTPEVLVEGS